MRDIVPNYSRQQREAWRWSVGVGASGLGAAIIGLLGIGYWVLGAWVLLRCCAGRAPALCWRSTSDKHRNTALCDAAFLPRAAVLQRDPDPASSSTGLDAHDFTRGAGAGAGRAP
jgi:hypothetical protein